MPAPPSTLPGNEQRDEAGRESEVASNLRFVRLEKLFVRKKSGRKLKKCFRM
jgi:hypothetical protein